MAKRVLHTILIALALTPGLKTQAQCTLQASPSAASYCAGQAITFEITNNQPGRTYQITVPALGITVNDTIATVAFPGASTPSRRCSCTPPIPTCW